MEESNIPRKKASIQLPNASPAQSNWQKYKHYDVAVDRSQNDKSKEIKLCSMARPHMRAFHLSWWSFFIAFFVWFAIVPLLADIQADLQLTKNDIWLSSIAGIGGTILVRFLLGPLCDVYGPRKLYAMILCIASIPTACLGFVNSATGLITLRLFIGIAGGTFVMCQYWTTVMFSKEIVGTANGIVGGWGNLGAGVTHLVIGMILYPLFQVFFDGDREKAWRSVCIVPAFFAFVTGVVVYNVGDDCPKGNYAELKQRGAFPEVTAMVSFKAAMLNMNSWLLFIQYACCFGVELTMNTAATGYFKDEFDLTPESAAAVATLFGWMNLFARGMGGFFSDVANNKWGMPGRLGVQSVLLALEAIFVIIFSQTKTLAAAIIVMVIFSFFVQAAEGSSFGIVPYVDEPHTGSVTGIVGAGGNVGAVCFSLVFKYMSNDKNSLMIMGGTVLISAVLSLFTRIEGYNRLFFCPFSSPEVAVPDEEAAARQNRDARLEDASSGSDG